MNVRDNTRARVQPYARSHPFGGGLNTSGALGLKYDPGHPLAGNWDTDSGYLKTALERGLGGLAVTTWSLCHYSHLWNKFLLQNEGPSCC